MKAIAANPLLNAYYALIGGTVMTIHGLNQYKSHATTERGIRNFQWVLPGVLARSAQPDYQSGDRQHEINFLKADFLKQKGITCVISSNKYALPAHSKTLLNTHGIAYYHFCIEDFKPASPEQLRRVADIVEANRKRGAALIYCGFGEGRTGTMVAGWAMVAHFPKQAGANLATLGTRSNLRANFGVETEDQANNVRRAANLTVELPGALPLPPGLGFGTAAPAPAGSGTPVNGPSGMGLPDDAAMPQFNFANFSSGWSDV